MIFLIAFLISSNWKLACDPISLKVKSQSTQFFGICPPTRIPFFFYIISSSQTDFSTIHYLPASSLWIQAYNSTLPLFGTLFWPVFIASFLFSLWLYGISICQGGPHNSTVLFVFFIELNATQSMCYVLLSSLSYSLFYHQTWVNEGSVVLSFCLLALSRGTSIEDLHIAWHVGHI